MIISKLNDKMQRYSRCDCRSKECAELNAWEGHGMPKCTKHAKYEVAGWHLCTDCMRFRRFPTEVKRGR